ncbi:MAG: tRNA (N(6)-L-threonylcarbamoyladenosine(37)-C(2))-methylthiotransferase MtaB [Candidatus Omnitrophica bacterium]|nr:tRNA (N(6)-L-threonylcarbamoyladenosine(37)-C(2))-methylthiotransferase MtaB [Candidatus Omnitrophota bacterium]
MNVKIKRTCAFFTFGCKVNQYETQLMREELLANGFVETEKRPAFLIVNGCTVTSRADKKCGSLLKNLSRKNPKAKIILTGCYAQNTKALKIKPEGVSCIIPQDQKTLVYRMIEREFGEILEDNNAAAHLPHEFYGPQNGISEFPSHNRAFVKIQDGCDNFCSYCIVPYMRGGPRSRELKEILSEAELLSKKGFKEIVLCGINLGAWGREFKEALEIGDLIKELNFLPGLKRLRLSSIELKHVNDSLIDKFSEDLKLCRHLHIPLQSGDSFILKKMNRDYSAQEYLDKLNLISSKIKDISFTTDIMVGFPGETDENFNNTLELVKNTGFTRIHVFTFSPRDGTPAARMDSQVDERIKKYRMLTLEDAAAQSSFTFRKKLLNKKLSVLFEKRENDYWCGYSDTYVYVKVRTNTGLSNTIKKVNVSSVSITDTMATVCEF